MLLIDLFDTFLNAAAALCHEPLSKPQDFRIVANGGGYVIILSDAVIFPLVVALAVQLYHHSFIVADATHYAQIESDCMILDFSFEFFYRILLESYYSTLLK